jgi:flagellar biosynthetic protein FliP
MGAIHWKALRVVLCLVLLFIAPLPALAQQSDLAAPLIQAAESARDVPVASTVKLLVILTGLTFVPAMLLVMTPFTRFIIVFSLLRQALGLQQSPPNQVLIGLAMFLSLLIMGPTLDEVKLVALDPFIAGEMETGTALELGMKPLRRFMLANTRQTDMAAVFEMARLDPPETLDEIPSTAVICAFVLSELTTAFIIAFKIYIPFLVVDIVVANVLLGMGMMVLPPVIISLPFKLMLFVLMDGWNLLVRSITASFAGTGL